MVDVTGVLRKSVSKPEDQLAEQMRLAGITTFERQYRFCAGRKWRADFHAWWAGVSLIVEVDGGLFLRAKDGTSGGRHNRGAGIQQSIEKRAEAVALGYRVMVVSPADVKSGRALSWIMRTLGRE